MSEPSSAAEAPVPALGSPERFAEAVAWAVRASIAGGARRITWVDEDFADWPLDDPALHTLLAGWLRQPGRRLVLLAGSYRDFMQRHPRFTAWRAPWVHAIDTLSVTPDLAPELPAASYDDGRISLLLIDRLHWRGRCSTDPKDAWAVRERFESLVQRATPDFPVQTLGL